MTPADLAALSRRPARLPSPGLLLFYGLIIAALAVLTVYPVIWLLIGSLRETDGGYGFANFIALSTTFRFARVLLNSWIYAFGSAALATLVGVALALLVARTNVAFRRLARLSAVLAFVSPPWLTAMAYVYIASPNAGVLNRLLQGLVGSKPFDVQSMGGMIFVTVLFLHAFVFLTVEAALASVDGSFEEAARVSGARPWQVATTVTLPLVAPAIISAFAFSIIIAWGLFAVPAILGLPSRIYVFSTQLYLFLQAFPPRLDLAAAMGVMFVATALIVGLLVHAARRRRRTGPGFAVIAGKGVAAAAMPLGVWRIPASLFILAVMMLAVALPYSVILWMSLNTQWYGHAGLSALSLANFRTAIFEYRAFLQVTGNSLKVALMEVTLVLVIATATAYFVRRTRLPGRRIVEGAALYTVLVPSVAFLTAVMWAFMGAPFGLYGSLVLIAMTQAARSLPIATRNIGDGFGQIDRSLEEAARVCGAGGGRVMATVTLPLLKPVLVAAFTVTFLSALRDLNTPLFLGGGSPRTTTLSVLIFQFWSETRIGEAAALTVVLLVLTLCIFIPLSRAIRR